MARQTAACMGLLLFVAAESLALESAGGWLTRMTLSHRQLDYNGVLTYQYADQLRSYRISHHVENDLAYESVESLDGPAQQLLRRDRDVNYLHTGPQLLQLLSQQEVGSFRRFYDVDVTGGGRVADRRVITLEIRPRDVYRLGYQLSLDEETALLLRSEALDQQGRVLERLQYVLLELDPPVPPDFTRAAEPPSHADVALASSSSSSSSSMATVTPASAVESLNWQPSWLPAGFAPASAASPAAGGLSFTDGLAVLTVFVDDLSLDSAGKPTVAEGSRRRGASVSYTALFPQRSAVVTVVGEVPLLTARQVAKSVVWSE